MGGVLNFSLEITGNPELLNRTAASFQTVGNAAAVANGPLGNTKLATDRLGKSAEATRQTMAAMQQVFSIFGGGVAPQVTGVVMSLANQFSALKSAIGATGASMTTLGIVGTAAATSIWAISDALAELDRLMQAKKQQDLSLEDYRSNLDARKKYLTELGKLAVGYDLMPQSELSDYVQKYNVVGSNYGRDSLNSAIEKRLKELGFLPSGTKGTGRTDSLEAYQNTLDLFQARNQGGDASQRQEIAQSAGRQLKEALKLAVESGKPFEPLRDEIFKWRDKQLADLDKKNLDIGQSEEGRAASGWADGIQNLTGLERLGLIIGTGVNGGGNDPARQTAENTRRMATDISRIAGTLRKPDDSKGFDRK